MRVPVSALAGSAASLREEGEPGAVCGPQQPGQHVLFEQCLTGEWRCDLIGGFHAHGLMNEC